jgi:hypothetical protein
VRLLNLLLSLAGVLIFFLLLVDLGRLLLLGSYPLVSCVLFFHKVRQTTFVQWLVVRRPCTNTTMKARQIGALLKALIDRITINSRLGAVQYQCFTLILAKSP